MVALRGKKAKAKASPANRKTVVTKETKQSKVAAAAKAALNCDGEEMLVSEEQPEISGEERVQRLVAFVTQAGLALHRNPQEPPGLLKMMTQTSVTGFLDAMLVAFCAHGKDKAAPPHQIMSRLTAASRKRVCGAIFSADEIAYSCRDCQVDSSCVICRDCFMHGDHSGHDVYFQRTTAGSSCDCGDIHAWKRAGFCTRHPGAEDDQEGDHEHPAVVKKSSLPKSLATMAPVVVDAVVEFLFQVYVGIDHGFEFADALEFFTRELPPSVLKELAATAVPGMPPQSVGTTTTTTTAQASTRPSSASSGRERRRSRQQSATSSVAGRSTETAVSTTGVGATRTGPSPPNLLAVRLHNDDVHSMEEVVRDLCIALDCSKHTARTIVTDADHHGDATVAKTTLLSCAAPVGTLVRKSMNVSVAPLWWEQQMETLPSILEWLRAISTASDGLYEIVTDALLKKRRRRLCAPASVSPFLSRGVTCKRFWKDQGVRMHSSALTLIAEWTGGEDSDLYEWATGVETTLGQLFQLRDDTSTTAGNVPVPMGTADDECKNVLILEFAKSVCETRAFSRQKSIRVACAALIGRYSNNTRDKQDKSFSLPASALALMVRWDCALRKRTAHLGHALLREHMLNKPFRKCMLETYASSYGAMTQAYLKGLGNSTDSIFDFAVQFLTVPHLVKQYTRSEVEKDPSKPQLAYELLTALDKVLATAVVEANSSNGSGRGGGGGVCKINVDHPVLTSQKYKHCIDDLEYIFSIGAMPNELVCDQRNLELWISCLKVIQNGDAQERRGIDKSHIEYESESWLSMFNLGIRIHSIFPAAWNTIPPERMADRKQVVRGIFEHVVGATVESSRSLNRATPTKTIKSLECLRENADAGDVATLDVYDFKVAVAPTSLHVPLHRFLASSIRQVGIHVSWFQDVLELDGLMAAFALEKLSMAERFELVELPLRSVVLASQIQSNMWRRNGEENVMAQLYNYSALPCCVHFRDVDVFLLQVGVILLGPDAMVSLLVERFQLGEFFLGFDRLSLGSEAFSLNAMGYAPRERGVDAQQEFQMVEELLRLMILLGTSLPSSVGEAYEESFLEDEMLQHLCAKSSSFSKLFDVAIRPTGGDDVSVPRLEQVLTHVANFLPPTGLEPGRYELKDGLLEEYNPYFIHLNREAHELARDRWTTYRKTQRQRKRAESSTTPPIAPLKPMRHPLPFLRQIRDVLTCEATLAIVHAILWKVAQDMVSSTSGAPHSNASAGAISDAVISTTLHLLVYGVHAAEDVSDNEKQSASFWAALCESAPAFGGSSMVSVMWTLAETSDSASTPLDGEQAATLQWLMWKIGDCSSVCAAKLDQLKQEKDAKHKKSSETTPGDEGSCDGASGNQPVVTLEQRKEDARKRALEAMARQQAAFQAMMADMEDDEDDEDDEHGDVSSTRVAEDDHGGPSAGGSSSALGKRRAGADGTMGADADEVKRPRLSNEAHVDEEDSSCYKCILCHDTNKQGEMGVAAYVHQSTVLAGSFRPEPEQGLHSQGAEVRKQVKVLIEKMDLCSGGPDVSSGSPSPAFHALAAQFPDWHMDDEFDELMLDSPLPNLHAVATHRQLRHHHNGAHMGTGTLGEIDPALQALEGVLDLREGQRLFPLPVHGTTPDGHDRGIPRLPGGDRAILVARIGAPPPVMEFASESDDDSDSDDGDLHGHHHHQHHHHHGHQHHPPHHLQHAHGSRGVALKESAPLYLTPCGLHIRTCQHAVHIHCLEQYIRSLHDKAIRGEDFDGVQAIDPDSAMTQFLCPLCKTLCNFLIPTSHPEGTGGSTHDMAMIENGGGDAGSVWHRIVDQQLKAPGWYRAVFGRDGDFGDDYESDTHDLWRDYFEETLWEPHGSLEKGAPFLWSACAFSLASFLNVAEDEFRIASGSSLQMFDPLMDDCPAALEKEFASLVDVTKFCRWSFSLLEHSGDAKVIWETSKRCCPINTETKREYRKFTKVLGSIDACLRGTILGLLVADTFTAFVVSSVIADSLATIWQCIPVFSAADLLQRVYTEFFVQTKNDDRSLLQDKFSIVDDEATTAAGPSSTALHGTSEDGESWSHRTRSRNRTRSDAEPAHAQASESSDGVGTRGSKNKKKNTKNPRNTKSAKNTKNTKTTATTTPPVSADAAAAAEASCNARAVVEAMREAEPRRESDEYALLTLLLRILDSDPDEKLKPLTATELKTRLQHIQSNNALLVRRMKLFWRCLSDKETHGYSGTSTSSSTSTRDQSVARPQMQIPSLAEVAASPSDVFDQVWKWCVDRMNSKSFLGIAKNGDKCEHSEGCGEGYIASMFILRDMATKPRLIDLPLQYDVLYSMMSGRKCTGCDKTPCDPGLCLVCGEFVCCGDWCCTRPFVNHGPQVGECTRHAAECGGGVGIVLMLDQCRVAIVGGSMAAHFPSPYVDAHGEEDHGLQRGRPLRLDPGRYRQLESLWVNHRIFSEVSRQRNQREPQYTIGLSSL